MKKFFGLFLCFAAAATVFSGCNSDDDKIDGGTPDAPVIKLVNGDIDAVQQIVTGMTVKVQVVAPGGIASFLIDIDSPALTPEELGSLGLAAQMDLANPASEEMAVGLKALGFPVGTEVKDATSLEFDLSRFMPMIAAIYPETSDHNFKLTVKDSQSKQTVKTLRFHLTVAEPVDPVLTYNADADLWANTASFTVTRGSLQGDLGVQYRVSGEERWYDAVMEDKGDGTSIARIAPEWEELSLIHI